VIMSCQNKQLEVLPIIQTAPAAKLWSVCKECDVLTGCVPVLQTISSLEKDIAGLKKEIGERDETIGDKEKRIYDLKKKNQVCCLSLLAFVAALA